MKEDVPKEWGWTRLEQVVRDAGYGLRQIRHNPVFSAVAIATLALGIGGIAAMFSAFDTILIRPLPYVDADRAVVAARPMTALFYGFVPEYIPAVGAVSAILLSVAAIACLVPARRASRIDPLIALRRE